MKNRQPELTRFDFDVHRFLNSEDVKVMTAEEVGEYWLLICESWVVGKSCTLSNNAEYLARIARVPKVSDRVLKKFVRVPGNRIRNNRIYQEWKRVLSRCKQGRKAALARHYGRNASAMRPHQVSTTQPNPYTAPYQPSANPTSKATSKSKSSAREPLAGFELFWVAYPRKVGKPAAQKAWLSAVQADDQWPQVVAAVEAWKKCEQWQEPRFIPYPATFLNQRRWQDQPAENPNGTGAKPYEQPRRETAAEKRSRESDDAARLVLGRTSGLSKALRGELPRDDDARIDAGLQNRLAGSSAAADDAGVHRVVEGTKIPAESVGDSGTGGDPERKSGASKTTGS